MNGKERTAPPAPWQHGMAPNAQPARFIAPTLTATDFGATGGRLSGNKSLESAHTATTELSVVSGSWGKPPMSRAVCSHDSFLLNLRLDRGKYVFFYWFWTA